MPKKDIPKLPYAMSPSDYAYVVLGKPPQMTSIIRYVNEERIPVVSVRIDHVDDDTGAVLKTSYQNWVRVPESERTLNKQYQKNVQAINSRQAKERWLWITEINSELLPTCPKLEQLKEVKRNVATVRGHLLPLLQSDTQYSKSSLVSAFMDQYGSEYPDIDRGQVQKVVDWFVRNNYVENTGKKHPEDARQNLIRVTKAGKKYIKERLNQ